MPGVFRQRIFPLLSNTPRAGSAAPKARRPPGSARTSVTVLPAAAHAPAVCRRPSNQENTGHVPEISAYLPPAYSVRPSDDQATEETSPAVTRLVSGA